MSSGAAALTHSLDDLLRLHTMTHTLFQNKYTHDAECVSHQCDTLDTSGCHLITTNLLYYSHLLFTNRLDNELVLGNASHYYFFYANKDFCSDEAWLTRTIWWSVSSSAQAVHTEHVGQTNRGKPPERRAACHQQTAQLLLKDEQTQSICHRSFLSSLLPLSAEQNPNGSGLIGIGGLCNTPCVTVMNIFSAVSPSYGRAPQCSSALLWLAVSRPWLSATHSFTWLVVINMQRGSL